MAAQIWAEPLGLVGHPDYYRLGDETVKVKKTFQQKALVVHFPGFYVRIAAQLSPRNISLIQHESIHALKSKFSSPLSLHRSEPCN
jgi:hypothetical protein